MREKSTASKQRKKRRKGKRKPKRKRPSCWMLERRRALNGTARSRQKKATWPKRAGTIKTDDEKMLHADSVAEEEAKAYSRRKGVAVIFGWTLLTSALPLLYFPFDDESPFRSAAFDIAFTISIWYASFVVGTINDTFKEYYGDEQRVKFELLGDFFNQPGLRETSISDIAWKLRYIRFEEAIKKTVQGGDSLLHRIFIFVGWAYTTVFLVTVPFVGLLYLDHAFRLYEKAWCVLGIIYVTIGYAVFLGFIGPALRASRAVRCNLEMSRLPAENSTIQLCYRVSYGCTFCFLPVAALCCDIPGFLWASFLMRGEKDLNERNALHVMKAYFGCASVVSVFAAVVLLFWAGIILCRDEILEFSIAVQEAVDG
uniref:Transmembrane protein n=1 Tax=Vitrella brassicaformis TaxID=1169539 RepID=A0A7S1P3A6_9ALVE|mmetsp:Transcript_24567/g.60722  ORF Transcript_24567/g.60722 Transcript_24567/m.60722 type:complete len:370 (+) Transcript_24567:113-1222(+)